MAGSHPLIAPEKYITQWLSEIEAVPGADMQADPKTSRRSKRTREKTKHHSEVPHERRGSRRRARSRNKSPTHRKARSVGEIGDGGHGRAYATSDSSSSDSSSDLHVAEHNLESAPRQQMGAEDSSKKYMRRPRHKTKTDKYEYKGDVLKRSPMRKPARKKHKRSQRKKSGNALIHDFKAPNVEQDRLTLKPNAGPGIFGKGKASALLQTRGLPDLTFSEMTFLTKRRQPEHLQQDQPNTIKPTKKKNRSKEISEFFAKPASEVAKVRRTSSEVLRRHQWIETTEQSRSSVPASPAKVAAGRELCRTSDYLSRSEPHSERGKRSVPRNDHHMTAGIKAIGQRTRHGSPAVAALERDVETSTSYYSWSATPSRPIPADPAVASSGHASHEMAAPQPRQLPKVGPPRESSVTNSSIDRYTKQMLLAKPDDLRQHSHRAPLGPNIFSLDDLKGLARVAEIEKKYTGLPITINGSQAEVQQRGTFGDERDLTRARTYSDLGQEQSAACYRSCEPQTTPRIRMDDSCGPSLTLSHALSLKDQHRDQLSSRVASKPSMMNQNRAYARLSPPTQNDPWLNHNTTNLIINTTDGDPLVEPHARESFFPTHQQSPYPDPGFGLQQSYDNNSTVQDYVYGFSPHESRLLLQESDVHEMYGSTIPVMSAAEDTLAWQARSDDLSLMLDNEMPELDGLRAGDRATDPMQDGEANVRPWQDCGPEFAADENSHVNDEDLRYYEEVNGVGQPTPTWQPTVLSYYPEPTEELQGFFARPQTLY